MKKTAVFLMLIVSATCSCQVPDSVLVKYNNAKTTVAKGSVLQNHVQYIKGTPKEKLKILLKELAYFTKEQDEIGVANTQLNIGYLITSIGDLNVSFKYGVSALEVLERYKDTAPVLSAYILIGNALNRSENNEQALKYYRKSYPIAKKYHTDSYYYSTILNNMADSFIKLKKPDSALSYVQEAVKIDYQNKDEISLNTSLGTLGEVYLAKKEYDIGRPFIRKAIYFGYKVNDVYGLAYSLNTMAESFYNTSQIDSSLVYAYQALRLASKDYDLVTLQSYNILYRNYEARQKQDSAYKYLKLAIDIKDRIFSEEKTRNIQSLEFNEEIRQQEVALEQQQIEYSRKQNIQYVLIGVGVISLIILFLLLSHTLAVNEKMVKIFSITGLLLVFEFLNLLLHPILEKVTGHSAILMLILLVCLALLIVPAHHKLEKWATRVLVDKNKKIRLAAAKKIIEKLEAPET
ncbi:MAG TPA: tetratricopeptide repeat protein [Flavobacterium sp.]|nr:tetratricopeptide repeat protein [Flavobacterium sp.]